MKCRPLRKLPVISVQKAAGAGTSAPTETLQAPGTQQRQSQLQSEGRSITKAPTPATGLGDLLGGYGSDSDHASSDDGDAAGPSAPATSVNDVRPHANSAAVACEARNNAEASKHERSVSAAEAGPQEEEVDFT